MTDPPVCDCHGAPKWWHTDRRRICGGYWICRVTKLERQSGYGAAYFQRRYDNDPVWRIERNLKRSREYRAATLAKRRQALAPEEGGTNG